jgi:phosphatidylglycerophosphatase A
MVDLELNLRSVYSKPAYVLAFGFGAGLAPKAPGTVGTVVAVPLYLLCAPLSWPLYLCVVALGIAVGVYVCGRAARALGVHDHPAIVWDEVAGFFLTMTAAPQGVVWLLLGFALFRFFDVLKPWPVGVADRRIHGGLGIMLDDVLAGVYAFLLLQLIVVVVG